MFIFLPSGWSRDWAEAQFGCSWSFSIIFLEPQFNWKDRNVNMKLKKKWGGFSFLEDGIDILFLSSSHQAKLITLTIIHKTSMSRLRREASPRASRPKEWHMVLPRLRERQTGNHRCHQETPAEALSLVKGPGQEQPQDRVLSDRNLCSSHTTRSSYPPSQASGHPSVPWPPSCRTAVPPPPSECQGRQLGQASNTHILTPWCSKPSFQSVPMHHSKKQEDLKVHEKRQNGDASVIWQRLNGRRHKHAIMSKQHSGQECREQEPRQRN